jgi:hypothetical protein
MEKKKFYSFEEINHELEILKNSKAIELSQVDEKH